MSIGQELPKDGLTEDEVFQFLGKPTRWQERRSRARQAYPFVQMVAEFQDGQAAPDTFYRVRCRNITTKGIGFHSPKQPTGDSLLIRLMREGDKPLLLAGKIAYCNDQSGNPALPFAIGCWFTQRLEA